MIHVHATVHTHMYSKCVKTSPLFLSHTLSAPSQTGKRANNFEFKASSER